MALDSDEDLGAILDGDLLEEDDDEEEDEPTLTFKVEHGRIRSKTDDEDAMIQAIDKILKTERNVYPIYDDQYGNDLPDLLGQDMDYAETEVERMIVDALEDDDRVTGVDIDQIVPVATDSLKVNGTCYTVYGDIPINEEVVINES